MDFVDEMFVEAQSVKKAAESCEMQSTYWQLVLGTLLEERAITDVNHFKRERKRIERAIGQYTKQARRIHIKHNKLMRRYNRKVQTWASPGKI